MRKSLFLSGLAVIAMLLQSPSARADGSSGFSQMFNVIFGNEASREVGDGAASSDCSTIDDGGGILGTINGIFCHLKYDMGITGVGSVTKTFGTMKVHVDIVNGCTGADGNGYLFGAKAWVCAVASGNCGAVTGYTRAMSICFSTDSALATNKGIVIMDGGAFSGDGGTGVMNIAYDLGTSSASQTVLAKMIFHNAATNHLQYGRADGTRTDAKHLSGTMLFVDNILSSSTAGRFAFSVNRVANTSNAYMEGFSASGSGTGSYSASAAGDTPSTGVCVTRTASGSDWSYSATSSGASCAPSVTFPTDSLTAVSGYTVNGLAGTWQGMGVNPSAL